MRIAVIGLGNAGFDLHLAALADMPSAEVVGAADLDPSRRQRAAERFAVPVFETLEQVLDDARPEVVVIATPPDLHADACLRSLEAGAHVLCEKPFVSSLEEADHVLDAARRAGRRVALNHEFREMPIFRALRDAVSSGDHGALRFAQVWQLMDLPPWVEPGWRGEMIQRTLYEAGVHLVDFLIALFGERPVAVQATTGSCGARESESDAVALVTLEFGGGRLAHVVQDRLCKGETQYFEVRADAERASLRASFGGRARLTAGLHRSTLPHLRVDFGVSGIAWVETGTRRRFLARNPKQPGTVATRLVLERTLEAFANGTAPPASGEDGRDVLEVIAACYRSAASGRRLRLDAGEIPELRAMKMGAPS